VGKQQQQQQQQKSSIHVIGISEEEEKGSAEKVFKEIMSENVPNLVKEIQVQEAQKIPKKMNPRRSTPQHMIKMLKVRNEERIFKTARQK